MDKKTFETQVDMTWAVDSETGDEVLIDCKTWRILAIKKRDGTITEVDRKGLDD